MESRILGVQGPNVSIPAGPMSGPITLGNYDDNYQVGNWTTSIGPGGYTFTSMAGLSVPWLDPTTGNITLPGVYSMLCHVQMVTQGSATGLYAVWANGFSSGGFIPLDALAMLDSSGYGTTPVGIASGDVQALDSTDVPWGPTPAAGLPHSATGWAIKARCLISRLAYP